MVLLVRFLNLDCDIIKLPGKEEQICSKKENPT